MTKIELGQEVKDRITGYQGIVVSVTNFLNGCRRLAVQRKFNPEKDEKTTEPEMFDEPDLEIIGHGIFPPPKLEPVLRRRTSGGNPNFKPSRAR